jgi:hypothetical protein
MWQVVSGIGVLQVIAIRNAGTVPHGKGGAGLPDGDAITAIFELRFRPSGAATT